VPGDGLKGEQRPGDIDVETRPKSSRSISTIGAAVKTAALLIRMSIRPNASTVSPTARRCFPGG
jgi:hypothetical protein